MQLLHAYWRMDYIEAPRYPESLKRPFAELPLLGDDRAALIVHRSTLTYLLLNRYPYNGGHLLAVPYRDVKDIEELTVEERADLMEEIVRARRILAEAIHPDGFNVGFNLGTAAGGSIAHLHAHIVPRWNGDTNFMPVIGQTRVLPLALDQAWVRLVAAAVRLGLRDAPAGGGRPRRQHRATRRRTRGRIQRRRGSRRGRLPWRVHPWTRGRRTGSPRLARNRLSVPHPRA